MVYVCICVYVWHACICVHVWVHVCVYICACECGDQRSILDVFPYGSLPHFLTYGSSLNLEVINSARMAVQKAQEYLCVCLHGASHDFLFTIELSPQTYWCIHTQILWMVVKCLMNHWQFSAVSWTLIISACLWLDVCTSIPLSWGKRCWQSWFYEDESLS